MINIPIINGVQTSILKCISEWVKNKKTPVPRKYIVDTLSAENIPANTTEAAIQTVIRKGFIRKISGWSAMYVQIRSI